MNFNENFVIFLSIFHSQKIQLTNLLFFYDLNNKTKENNSLLFNFLSNNIYIYCLNSRSEKYLYVFKLNLFEQTHLALKKHPHIFILFISKWIETKIQYLSNTFCKFIFKGINWEGSVTITRIIIYSK